MTVLTVPPSLRVERRSITFILSLAAIVFVGAGLRFYKLGDWSFWIDEYITVRGAEGLSAWDVTRYPAFLALVGATTGFLGISEWSARLVSALVGIITIPAIFLVARRMFDNSVAVLASFLLAISIWHIYWSQNARFYTIILLLHTVALFAFYIGIEEDRPLYLVASAVLLFMGARERAIVMMLIPIIGIYLGLLLVLPFERPKGLNLRNVLLLIALSVGLAIIIGYPFLRATSEWTEPFNRINTNPLWILAGVIFYVGIVTVVMAAFGGAYLLRIRDRAALLLAVGAIVPLFSVMAISLVQYAANRYVFITLPSYLILASVAIRELFRRSDQAGRYMATGVLAILVLTTLSEDVLYYQFQNGNRDDWKGALEIVKSRMKPEDLVISSSPSVASYYLGTQVVGMDDLNLDLMSEMKTPVWFIEDMNAAERFSGTYNWVIENADLIANLDVHVRARNFLMRVHYYDPTGK